ncbi:MAG: hypothetical protein GY716_15225 [bacterium]|nr:hypothetical protein [bacterium]
MRERARTRIAAPSARVSRATQIALVVIICVVSPVADSHDSSEPGDAHLGGLYPLNAPPPRPAADSDGDGVGDDLDNCPEVPNADQSDSDADSIGDMCDNCPTQFNPDQGSPVLLSGSSFVAYDYEFSPEDEFIVFLAATETLPPATRLQVAATVGGAPVTLNGPLVPGGRVSDFEIAADGLRVVYQADEETRHVAELFSVPLIGGTPVKLNDPLADDDVIDFTLTPDASHAVFRTGHFISNEARLHAAPVTGGPTISLDTGLGGMTHEFLPTSDSQRVVFTHEYLGQRQLFGTPASGGAPVRLDSLVSADGDVREFLLSNDGSRVFYTVGRTAPLTVDLYAVPVGGGTPIHLLGPFPGWGAVHLEISPDDSRVILQVNDDGRIHSVETNGGSPIVLDDEGATSNRSISITPDGSSVVYLAQENWQADRELFVVPIEGGTRRKLNAPLFTHHDVISFVISHDGNSLVYQTHRYGGPRVLFFVPLPHGQAERIVYPFYVGETYYLNEDGTRVLFSSDDNDYYVASTLGGTPRRVTSGIDHSSGAAVNHSFTQTAFRAESRLFGSNLRLDDDLDGLLDECDPCVDRDFDGFGDPESPVEFECPLDNCPDVANPNQTDDDGDQIGSACDNCPGDSNPEQANVDSDGYGDVCDPCPGDSLNDPDLDGVCGGIDNCRELANPDQLDSDEDSVGDACDLCPWDYDPFQRDWDEDGAGNECDVCPGLYNPDQTDGDSDGHGDECDNCPDANNVDQLDTDLDQLGNACDPCPLDVLNDADADGACADADNCPIDPNPDQSNGDEDHLGDACDNCPSRTNPHQRIEPLNGPLSYSGDVYEGYGVTPDAAHAVYLARVQGSNNIELFSAPATGGDVVPLSHTPYDDVMQFVLSGDGSVVVYWLERDGLFTVPVVGGVLPTSLNTSRHIASFATTWDGSSIVYSKIQGPPWVRWLFHVSSEDGVSTQLSPYRVSDFTITPDETRVVYHEVRPGAASTLSRHLAIVPIEGGAPLALSPPLPSGGNVNAFSVTPDSSRAIYLANQEASNRIELFSVKLDGTNLVKLNNAPSTAIDVLDFRTNRQGTHVVYSLNPGPGGPTELFSVPVGGGDSTKLNNHLVSGGEVMDFVIDPSGTMVVYRADQLVDDEFELYSVPIVGGSVARLNAPLIMGGDVGEEFFVTNDGAHVVYPADQDTNDVVELYATPIGGGDPVKLSTPEVLPGSLVDVTPDGSMVLYASASSPGLYSVPIGGGTPALVNASQLDRATLVPDLSITPDGAAVLFRSNPNRASTMELFSAPIELDTDSDGVLDDCDGCPLDSAKIDPGVCGCGLSDSESDPPDLECPADAILDCGTSTDPTATGEAVGEDACGTPTLDFVDSFVAECGGKGTLTRDWTATDPLGNVAACAQTLTLQDSTPPAVTPPPDLLLECNTFGGVSIDTPAVQDWLAGAVAIDACGEATAPGHDAPLVFPGGSTLGQATRVTFDSADECENASVALSSLVVLDTMGPVVTCAAQPVPGGLRVEFEAVDACSAVLISAVIRSAGAPGTIADDEGVDANCSSVAVSSGQMLALECRGRQCDVDSSPPDQLRLEAHRAELIVTARDEAGNMGRCRVVLCEGDEQTEGVVTTEGRHSPGSEGLLVLDSENAATTGRADSKRRRTGSTRTERPKR